MTGTEAPTMLTVLVTGGTGLVGSHIVQVLLEQEYARWRRERSDRPETAGRQHDMLAHGGRGRLQEIRVFSRSQFNVSSLALDFSPGDIGVKVKHVQGTLTSRDDIARALENVSEVYHCAAQLDSKSRCYVPQQLFAVNVEGTRDLLELAKGAGVKRIVYTSSMAVSVPWSEDVVDGTEETAPKPKGLPYFMCGAYAYTKSLAEADVLASNSAGLRTLSLRIPTVYGERDRTGLTITLQNPKPIPMLGHPTKAHHAYAGNLAWAHLCAMDGLRTNPGMCSGREYYVNDDLPSMDLLEFQNKVIEAVGFGKAPAWRMPLWPLMTIAWIIELFGRFSFCLTGRVPDFMFRRNVLSPLEVNIFARTFYFSDAKARRELKYTPLYSPKESITRTVKYSGLQYISDTFEFEKMKTRNS